MIFSIKFVSRKTAIKLAPGLNCAMISITGSSTVNTGAIGTYQQAAIGGSLKVSGYAYGTNGYNYGGYGF